MISCTKLDLYKCVCTEVHKEMKIKAEMILVNMHILGPELGICSTTLPHIKLTAK